MIKDWSERIGIDESIKVGVIEGSILDENYLKIFRLKLTQGFLYLTEEGEILYSEREGDGRMMSSEFIVERLR